MKKISILAVLLTCSSSNYAFSQIENAKGEGATAPQLKSPTNSELISLSRAEKINIVADATFFSSAFKAQFSQEEDVMRSLLKIAYINDLSLRQLNNRTFLIWSEPDTPAVVKALIAESEKANERSEVLRDNQSNPNIFGDLYADIENRKAGLFLADYLRRIHGWDGQSANLNIEFKASELPSESADSLINLALSNVNEVSAQKQKAWLSDTPWLSDDLWKNAYVGYYQTPGKEMVLAIRGTNGQRDYFRSLGKLMEPSKAAWQPTKSETAVQKGIEADKMLPQGALQSEKSLASLISFEKIEVPIKSLVAEMQRLGNVKLELAPDLLSDKKVTVSVVDMPLYNLMDGLTQLYGIRWVKRADRGYVATLELSAAQVDALQLGDYQWFRYWKEPARRTIAPAQLQLPELVNLKTELANVGIEDEQLMKPQGVELSALPQKFRELIRSNIEGQISARLIDQYKTAFIDNNDFVGQNKASMSIRVRPSTSRVIIRNGAQAINTAPPLNAIFVVDGKELYTLGVYGQTSWKGIQSEIRQYETLREKMNPQGQVGGEPK